MAWLACGGFGVLALLALLLPRLPARARAGRAVVPVAGAALAVLLVAFSRMSDAAPAYYLGGALGVSVATAVLIAGLEMRPTSRLARTLAPPIPLIAAFGNKRRFLLFSQGHASPTLMASS